jgi:hypothetical protein
VHAKILASVITIGIVNLLFYSAKAHLILNEVQIYTIILT